MSIKRLHFTASSPRLTCTWHWGRNGGDCVHYKRVGYLPTDDRKAPQTFVWCCLSCGQLVADKDVHDRNVHPDNPITRPRRSHWKPKTRRASC